MELLRERYKEIGRFLDENHRIMEFLRGQNKLFRVSKLALYFTVIFRVSAGAVILSRQCVSSPSICISIPLETILFMHIDKFKGSFGGAYQDLCVVVRGACPGDYGNLSEFILFP